MSEKRFRVNNLVKYDYSEIGEYIDENHTDRPLRNDEIVDLLNQLNQENEHLIIGNKNLMKKNEQLKERNEKLQWELDKTREDLNYFANLKIIAIGGEPK